ncbi:hypothetical protein PoB_000333700 [Plakobranchus ocellatus]|uniref:Uncharacterized protein n=1 Tax=Plakobranchus ocellatus TaxID=259542 RepID=A0AAV3Y283_9GAST|nr:hypothetical protein PoB_000333700 [Plakobranchus ocellatus]
MVVETFDRQNTHGMVVIKSDIPVGLLSPQNIRVAGAVGPGCLQPLPANQSEASTAQRKGSNIGTRHGHKAIAGPQSCSSIRRMSTVTLAQYQCTEKKQMSNEGTKQGDKAIAGPQ